LKNRVKTHLIGPKGKFKEKIFWIAHPKNLVSRKLSHRENRNPGKNRRKRIKKIFENSPRAYKVLIKVKKNSKLSHACVPLKKFCFYPFKLQSANLEWKQKEGKTRI
jgi:hypothetical protein